MSKNTTIKTKPPGRNDPCSCGSGKKYKKCHGANVTVTTAAVSGDQFEYAHALFEQGQFPQALEICLGTLQSKPRHVDALHLAGLIEAKEGWYDDAQVHLSRAAKLQPKNHWIHSNLSLVYLRLGRLDEAEQQGKKAISLAPDFAGAWNNLGNVYRAMGKFDDALSSYSRSLEYSGPSPEVFCNMGLVLEQLDRNDAAKSKYQAAISAVPGFARAYVCLGDLAREDDDLKSAFNYYNEALSYDPNLKEAHCSIARAYLDESDFETAKSHFLAALDIDAKDVDSIMGFAGWFERQEQWEAAKDCIDRAARIAPDSPLVHVRLAGVLSAEHRYKEALIEAQKAVDLEPGKVSSARLRLADVYKDFGKHDKAREIYRELIGIDKDNAGVYRAWADLEEKTSHLDEALQCAEHALQLEPDDKRTLLLLAKIASRRKDYKEAKKQLDKMDIEENCTLEFCSSVLFEYGNVFDKLKQYDAAMGAYTRAAELRGRDKNSRFEPEENTQWFAKLKEFYTRESIAALPRYQPENNVSKNTPVFIVGLTRSGTTLLEQILCSHPGIVAGGELTFIQEIADTAPKDLDSDKPYPECLEALNETNGTAVVGKWREYYLARAKELDIDLKGANLFTDKMPLNMTNLFLIGLLFPESPIIHIVRNPMDACLSSMFSNFAHRHEWANNIVHVAAYCREVFGLVEHYKENLEMNFMQLRYEDLVADQEKWSRKVIEFVGVDWDNRVMEFYKIKRVARTASYAQVNQKIYTTSVERYKKYEKHLKEPLEILAPVMKQYGYL